MQVVQYALVREGVERDLWKTDAGGALLFGTEGASTLGYRVTRALGRGRFGVQGP